MAASTGDPGLLPEGVWDTIAHAADTIEQNPHLTILPPSRSHDTAGQRAVDVLTELANAPTATGPGGSLALGRTLGEGGMGVVWLGTQLALGRQVAVKTLRPEHRTESTTVKLLREAWVTGTLEHPNVVPVYEVGIDGDGSPIIVLKRIAGVEWGALMRDGAVVEERFGTKDLLEWNLQILLDVCDAIRFAHDRDIVHRDLKPENVMVGEFGEVYVLDWGIAVSMVDDGSGRLPLASEATQLAGTPSYMAPEMLGGSEPRITPKTDVYLLGAILYEVLTGRAPHRGANLMQIVRSIMSPELEWPASVPAELRRICEQAMSSAPEDRFESAGAFRAAVQGFLQHRGSMLLADEARRSLSQLEGELTGQKTEDDEAELRIYNLFGECRFGFQQALRAWGENPVAREGLHHALTEMIDHQLIQGDAKAASVLFSELRDPPRELAERVANALRLRDQEQGRLVELERMQADLDPGVGKRTRTFIGVALGLIWAVMPWGMASSELASTHAGMAIGIAVVLLIVAALGLWARDSMSKTAINRGVLATLVTMFSGMLSLQAGAALLGISPGHTQVLHMLLWFAAAGALAVSIYRRFTVVALGYLAAFVLAARWPEHRFWAMSGSNVLLTAVVVWISWTDAPDRIGGWIRSRKG